MADTIFQARKNQKYNSLSTYAKLHIDFRKCETDEKKLAAAIHHKAIAVIKWFITHKDFSEHVLTNAEEIEAIPPHALPLTENDHTQIAKFDAMPSSLKLADVQLKHQITLSASSVAQKTVLKRILDALEGNDEITSPDQDEVMTAENPNNKWQNGELSLAAKEIQSVKDIFCDLKFSIFHKHGIQMTPKENDHQISSRLYNMGLFEEALKYIIKFKKDTLDTNPYSLGHKKSIPVFIVHDVYRIMANCYRHLRRYSDAIRTLEDMRCIMHNAQCTMHYHLLN